MYRTESLELHHLPSADFEPGPENVVPIPLSVMVEIDLLAWRISHPDFQPLAGGEGGDSDK